MTQEEKELLLKDLCARLPYGVKVSIKNSKNHSPVTVCEVTRKYICIEGGGEKCFSHGTYQPYLRPMSSMTEEELLKFEGFKIKSINSINVPNIIELIDWFNAHHFDYHGLIEKGLALEAPEDMYTDSVNPQKEN